MEIDNATEQEADMMRIYSGHKSRGWSWWIPQVPVPMTVVMLIAIMVLSAGCSPSKRLQKRGITTFDQFYTAFSDYRFSVVMRDGQMLESRRHERVGADSLRVRSTVVALADVRKVVARKASVAGIAIAATGTAVALLTNLPEIGCQREGAYCTTSGAVYGTANTLYKIGLIGASISTGLLLSATKPRQVYVLNPR